MLLWLTGPIRDPWDGPETTNMRAFDPGAEISFWLRVGGHSVVSEDIDAFTAFMTAHFESESTSEMTLQSAR